MLIHANPRRLNAMPVKHSAFLSLTTNESLSQQRDSILPTLPFSLSDSRRCSPLDFLHSCPFPDRALPPNGPRRQDGVAANNSAWKSALPEFFHHACVCIYIYIYATDAMIFVSV